MHSLVNFSSFIPFPFGPHTPTHPEVSTLLLLYVVQSLGRVRLFAAPRTVAHQAPLSVGFLRQEYWIGLPFPSPGDLLDLGIKPTSPTFQVDSLPLATREALFWFLPPCIIELLYKWNHSLCILLFLVSFFHSMYLF